MSEHPWTPGPWKWVKWCVLASPQHKIGVMTTTKDLAAENKALIALAPEMAEAILEYDEDYPCTELANVAEKLRQIGS